MSVTPKARSRCSSPSPRRSRPRAASAGTIRESLRTRSSSEPSSSSQQATFAEGTVNREPSDLPKRRRVKSAVADDRIYRMPDSNKGPWSNRGATWGQTSYNDHYSFKKPIATSKPRPASATRMNNPHPSKLFMQWRIPTRIHPHSRSMPVHPSFLKDIQERFYQDYLSDQNNTGKAMNEVPITNVAKIPFPGQNNLTGLEVTGNKLSLANKETSNDNSQQQHLKISSAAVEKTQDQILQQTLQPSSYAAYQQWTQVASAKERDVLTKMVKLASIEDSKTKQMLSNVFNKHSIKHVKTWMHGADEQELATAISVIDQLSRWSKNYDHSYDKNVTKQQTYGNNKGKAAGGVLYKSRSWPRKHKPSSTLAIVGPNEFGILGKKLRPHSADMCSDCSEATLGSMYKALKSNRLNLQHSQDSSTNPKPTLWNHKIKPPVAPRLLNRGAVFNLPQKACGQHFTLHPEWPTA